MGVAVTQEVVDVPCTRYLRDNVYLLCMLYRLYMSYSMVWGSPGN